MILWADLHADTAHRASAYSLEFCFHILAAFFGVKNIFSFYSGIPVAALYCVSGAGFNADVAAIADAFGNLIVAFKRAIRKKSSKPYKAAVFLVKKQRVSANRAKP